MAMLKTLVICFLLFFAGGAASQGDKSGQLGTVHLQLRWTPQFQFAGYYAAVEKGFYREEGLDVHIHAGAPDRQPVAEVLAGRAEYAEGNSEVLLAHLRGSPLVALAAIFQHSPSVLLTLKKSGLSTPRDLIGKKVMFMDSKNDPDFLTMLLNEGISPSELSILPSSYNLDDLISGKVDAFNSYLTNEPYFLQKQNIFYSVINPRDFRADFCSDILFTSELEIRTHPQRVAAMRRASLKGWRYAMDHPDEVIEFLIQKYGVQKSREHLRFEAEAMRHLILPDSIEIGHINRERLEKMADTFSRTGLIGPRYSLEGFIYDEREQHRLPEWATATLAGGTLLLLLITLVALHFIRTSRRLARADEELRTANKALSRHLAEIQDLHCLLQEQAVRDPLTGLYNRRYLDETLEREVSRAKREGYPISLAMIDLDHFKRVNDTYGHKAGDEVLKILGTILQSHAREGDIPCRYGGEEFLLVLPRMAPEVAQARAEHWREAFAARRIRHGEFEIHVTMSIGLATYPNHALTADALILSADHALYQAKAAGRNRLELADPLPMEPDKAK